MKKDMVGVFGFKTDIEFSRDEFFLFLDCVLRGLSKLLIVKGQNKPTPKIKRISSASLNDIVNWIYKPGEDYINREEFLGYFSLLRKNTKRRCLDCEALVNFFNGIFPQMEQSLTYGRERSIELLTMKLECRKFVHEYIKAAVDQVIAKNGS